MNKNWFWVIIFPVILGAILGFLANAYFFNKENEHTDERWVTALNHITDVVQEGMGKETAIQELEYYIRTLEQKNEDLGKDKTEASDKNEGLQKQLSTIGKEKDNLERKLETSEKRLKESEEKYNILNEKFIRLEQFLAMKYSTTEIIEVENSGIDLGRENYQLSELVELDHSYASLIDGFTDCFGKTHGEAIKFSSQSSEIRFALDKKFDTLVITPFTSTDTRSDGVTRFEFYVDGEKRGVIEKVEKGGRYDSITVVVTEGDVLTIKAIQMPYSGEVFLSETSLQVFR